MGLIRPDPNLRETLPGRLYNEICAHARETLPEECCGLISGDASVRYRTVHRCKNDMTLLHAQDPITYPHDGTQAFHMREVDYWRVEREAEARNERVTAVYHSHVGWDVWLSEVDQRFASDPLFPFPDADQIVISMFDRREHGLGLFRRDPATGVFSGRCLDPEAP